MTHSQSGDDRTVPDGWHLAPLGRFGDFKSGNGFPLKYQGRKVGDIPFYKVSDMSVEGNSVLMTDANHWIDESARRILGAHIMPPNAIIFAKIGAAIFLERRRILSMNSCVDNNVMAFIPSANEANSLFFYYLMQSVPFGPLVAATALPSLSGKIIGALSFSFPPVPEQKAIASALNDIDDLIASLDALIAKKRDIKQAAMQQLLTGKTRLPGFEGKWSSIRLGHLVEFSKGRGLPKSALKQGGPAPCIHYGELFTQYGPSISMITSRTVKTQSAVFSRANDVLMPTSDVTPRGLAKASCVLVDGVIIGGDTLIIRPDPAKLNGVFLAYLIRQSEPAVLNLVRGSTVFHIYATDLSRLELYLPRVEEQIAIAEVLTEMDHDLDCLAIKRTKAASIKQGMMQQLLTGRIRLV